MFAFKLKVFNLLKKHSQKSNRTKTRHAAVADVAGRDNQQILQEQKNRQKPKSQRGLGNSLAMRLAQVCATAIALCSTPVSAIKTEPSTSVSVDPV